MKSMMKRLFTYLSPHMIMIIVAIISSIISVFAMLYIPVIVGRTIDLMIGINNVQFDAIARSFPIIIILIGLYTIFNWLMNVSTAILTQRVLKAIRIDLFKKIHKIPLKYLDNHPHGDLMKLMVVDIENISIGLLQGFIHLFTGVVTIVITVILMFALNWLLGTMVVIITPLSLLVTSKIAKNSHLMYQKKNNLEGVLSGMVEETIGNQKNINNLGYQEQSFSEYQKINEDLHHWGFKSQWYSAIVNPLTRFINSLIYALVGIIGVLLIIKGDSLTFVKALSVGALFSFLNYSNQYIKPFNEISGIINELQTALVSCRRVFQVLNEEEEISDSLNANLNVTSGSIAMTDVSFSYDDKELIENFNLFIKPGQKIALVGPTGCGKTTIINLLMRFYDIKTGSIEIDQEDIRNVTRKSLRHIFGMVLQDSWLFKGSVYENIAYGKPDATNKEIEEVARASYIDYYIKKLPAGYHTQINDLNSLSEGEKQLLCIARVMLIDPMIIILDEATSNIDTLTEIRITHAFAQMAKNRTTIVIAHRLSTIVNSDLIVVMDKGQIIETGKHQELLDKQGFYYNLYKSQFEIF